MIKYSLQKKARLGSQKTSLNILRWNVNVYSECLLAVLLFCNMTCIVKCEDRVSLETLTGHSQASSSLFWMHRRTHSQNARNRTASLWEHCYCVVASCPFNVIWSRPRHGAAFLESVYFGQMPFLPLVCDGQASGGVSFGLPKSSV